MGRAAAQTVPGPWSTPMEGADMPQPIPNKPTPHGSRTGYKLYKCRCDDCRAAEAAYKAGYAARNPGKAREASRRWEASNRDRAREQRRIRRERNREQINERQRARRLANLDRERAYQAAWRAANRERLDALAKAWRAANLDRALENNARWKRENPQRVKELSISWYAANVDRKAEQSRAWYAAHPEALAAKNSRRRVRVRGADCREVTKRDWRRLCARHDHCCAYCGKRERLTLEHVIPLSRGGRHSIGNLLPACLSCNSSKQSKLLIEWRFIRRNEVA